MSSQKRMQDQNPGEYPAVMFVSSAARLCRFPLDCCASTEVADDSLSDRERQRSEDVTIEKLVELR